ncbi:hypothetical protein [Microlunatus soli]|uniref:hypothetical protein n=1 Tax=Microlunatus soli TaxID=630515 RepID=UPI0012FA9094|nr:hypothetical protein [Microlunatus soli]
MTAVVGVLVAVALAVPLVGSSSAAAAAPGEPHSGSHVPATELPHVECAIPAQADDNVLVILKHVADQRQVTDKVRLAMYETAWVESHANNLNCGDRDSVGVFQQRPSMGWGTVDQLLNVDYATGKFLDGNAPLPGAIVVDQQNPGWTAGEVSQEVQRSAYPERYDQAEGTARELIARAAEIDDGTTPPPSHYFVNTFADAPVFDSPTSTTRTGTLNEGSNYVYCKVWGRVTGDNSTFNHWWLKTDPDVGPAGQYVSAYYLSGWGNDEANDVSGTEIRDC